MGKIDKNGARHADDGKYTHKPQSQADFDLKPSECAPEAERAFAPDVSYDELVAMAQPTAPVEVRMAVAATLYPGVAERASHDPDPFVRTMARDGWDLPEEDAARLDSDPHVQRLRDILAGRG